MFFAQVNSFALYSSAVFIFNGLGVKPPRATPSQIYLTFPDRREGSNSSLILKRVKTKKSNRVLYMTKPLLF